MVGRCIAAGCSNVAQERIISLHYWPKDGKISRLWKKFVNHKRGNWTGPCERSQVCSAHFTPDQFTNYKQFRMGFVKKLILKDDAIPTIQANSLARNTDEKQISVRSAPPARSSYPKKTTNEIPPGVNAMIQEDATEPMLVEDTEPEHHDTHTIENDLSGNSKSTQTQTQSRSVSTYTDARFIKSQKRSRTIGTQTDMTGKPKTQEKMVQARFSKPRQRASTPIPESWSESDGEMACDDPMDISWNPELDEDCDFFDTNTPREDIPTMHQEAKYIVFRSKLWELFAVCPTCSSACLVEESYVKGTMIQVHQTCPRCNFDRKWNSQPFIKNIPAGNLLLSGAITFTGLSQTKVLRLLDSIGLANISLSTCKEHNNLYIYPTVWHALLKEQKDVTRTLKDIGGKLQCAGDGRADSPGYCAKYGTYTLLETRLNKVLVMDLVQSNQVGGSTHMELQGLKNCLSFLKSEKLELGTLVTDRHPQVQRMMREDHNGVDHHYDIWHVAKGFSKKAEAIAKQKDCQIVRPWIKSMVNHMYWCASSTPDGDRCLIEAKWRSLSNHIQDIHEGHSEIYPSCEHPTLTPDQMRVKKFLQPDVIEFKGTKACVQLVELINNTRLCTDIRKLSPHQQTSSLEAFNSLILHWVPKRTAFGFHGMVVRQSLACLHYNENNARQQAKTADGQLRYTIVFPKAKKGDYTVRPVKEKATFKYIEGLFETLSSEVMVDPSKFQRQFQLAVTVPPPLAAGFQHPSRNDAIDKYNSITRYSAKSSSCSALSNV